MQESWQILENLDTVQHCVNCRREFTERENLGEWKCYFHPLPINEWSSGINYAEDVFECCGRPDTNNRSLSRGCVRSHHNASRKSFTLDDNVCIDLETLQNQRITLSPSNASIIPDESVVVIQRFDAESFQNVSNYGQSRVFGELSRSSSCGSPMNLSTSGEIELRAVGTDTQSDFYPQSVFDNQSVHSPIPMRYAY